MKASDLRIGNLVKQGVVESIGSSLIQVSDTIYESEVIEPIELTEKLLLKFGFKGTEGYYYDLEIGAIEFYYEDGILVCDIYNYRNENVKYVHQLQNIFFDLTNKELKIN
jgi:hypothetical protein